MERFKIREEWLEAGRDEMAGWLADAGYALPPLTAVTCGWPSKSGLATKKRRIGECWSNDCSDRGTFEIFISPVLESPADVLHVLLHEMVHAAVGLECGHKNPFAKTAKKLGMVGKMTATEIGDDLRPRLEAVAFILGDYPHRKLNGKSNGPKKQSTRMLKAVCDECGYTIRLTKKWAEAGLPSCPCNQSPMSCPEAAEPGDDGEGEDGGGED